MMGNTHQLKQKKSSEVSEDNHEQVKRPRETSTEKEVECCTENKEEVAKGKPVEDKAGPSKPVEGKAGTSTITPEEGCFDFNVFISFRGKDTRNGFTSHLHKELAKTRGITTFIDSEGLIKGEKISELFKHIEGSKIFMPVFSENYADSKWCLREIAKMVKINKIKRQERPIIPIFYHVEPSNVRNCRESFEKAFKKHQKDKELGEEEINEWKTALNEAGELSGYCFPPTEGDEAELITLIGKVVTERLCKDIPFDIQPVGIGPYIYTLKQMLERENDRVCMIGICGQGGIGKTTLAMALFNDLSHEFEGSCFLRDIRESEKKNMLPTLQAKLIKEVLREDRTIGSVEQGVSLIKERLKSKKILLILDDVDHIHQLEAFTSKHGQEQWFRAGSKIIMTTRDERVLLQHGLEKDDIYVHEGLNRNDSLQLFCSHAFGSNQPLVGFEELCWEVVKAAGGLPLALKVFGPLFCALKEDRELWEELLRSLKGEQHKEVHERLKISYDRLNRSEQSVFLDIACLFIGKEKTYPVYMWDACGYFPKTTLQFLQNMSLIKIDKEDIFEMHDQIRDMGRMIVKEEGNSDLLKYSRPWNGDQLLEVLRDAK